MVNDFFEKFQTTSWISIEYVGFERRSLSDKERNWMSLHEFRRRSSKLSHSINFKNNILI